MRISKILFIAFAGLLISSCQPYEEGPKLSLRSSDARLQQQWLLDEIVYSDGNSINPSIDNKYTFGENGSLTINTGGDIINSQYSVKDKTKLSIEYSETTKEDFEILRLTKTELWLEAEGELYINKFISIE